MSTLTQVKDTSTAPGANGNTTNLFNTVLAGMPANGFQQARVKRFVLDIQCSQNGTLKPYKSANRGVTWTQLDSISVTASGTSASLVYDFLVEPYADWKLDWVNGGAAQATWLLDMAMTGERALAG